MRPLLAMGVAWGGYLLIWFGWGSLQNKNWGLADLALPTRYAKLAAIQPGSAPGASPSGGSSNTPPGLALPGIPIPLNIP